MCNTTNGNRDEAARRDTPPEAALLAEDDLADETRALETMKDALRLYGAAYRRLLRESVLDGCRDVIKGDFGPEQQDIQDD